MNAVRVRLHADVASFRMPHFLVGRQLSYPLPPPSTLIGLITAALGRPPGWAGLRMGYRCTVRHRGFDLEHQHIITAGGGRKHPGATTEASVQPVWRGFLFDVCLDLYLVGAPIAELRRAFLCPAYCLTLGRSQDLASVTAVEELTLEETTGGYVEGTILPFAARPLVATGVTMLMTRSIGPPPMREPRFERYVIVDRWVGLPRGAREEWLRWSDPRAPTRAGEPLVVPLHSVELLS